MISNNTFKAVTTGPPVPSMSVLGALAILAGLLLLTFNGKIRREIWRVSPSRG